MTRGFLKSPIFSMYLEEFGFFLFTRRPLTIFFSNLRYPKNKYLTKLYLAIIVRIEGFGKYYP